MNLVELMTEDDEQYPAPCKFGNIVDCHACYCHHESPDAPRKCPIWREGEFNWKRGEWDDGACPLFEPRELTIDDGFNGPVDAKCEVCECYTMVVVRPGKYQCQHCD